jgi:hypothetical protein
MKQQRLKLETQLSAGDKKQLEDLQKRLATNREAGKSFRQERKTQPKADKPAQTDAQRQQMQLHRAEMERIMADARTLAVKYDSNIQALFKEISSSSDKWKTDLEAIHQKHQVAAPAQPNQPPRHQKRGRAGHVSGSYMRPVAFLLWDVKQDLPAEGSDLNSGNQVFPNPATITNTLKYTVKQAGKVQIDLLDDQGNLLRTLENGPKTKGDFQLEVPVSELKSGIYVYKISTKAGVETKRFVKK